MAKITMYRDYWPEYLREHSQAATRICHYLHTGLGGMFILGMIYTQNLWGLLIILSLIFCSALFSHIVFEGNKPAAAKYPFWWSVFNDMRMLHHFLTGSLKAELEAALNSDDVIKDKNK